MAQAMRTQPRATARAVQFKHKLNHELNMRDHFLHVICLITRVVLITEGKTRRCANINLKPSTVFPLQLAKGANSRKNQRIALRSLRVLLPFLMT